VVVGSVPEPPPHPLASSPRHASSAHANDNRSAVGERAGPPPRRARPTPDTEIFRDELCLCGSSAGTWTFRITVETHDKERSTAP
jgi:hypothetical protein